MAGLEEDRIECGGEDRLLLGAEESNAEAGPVTQEFAFASREFRSPPVYEELEPSIDPRVITEAIQEKLPFVLVSDDLGQFWSSLQAGSFDSSSRLLQFPPLQIKRFSKSQLYVYPEYEILFAKIWDERVNGGKNEFVILGNPGIGKTVFGLYFMWRLVQKNITFMYEESLNGITLYTPGHTFRMDRNKAKILCEQFEGKFFYLCDLTTDDEPDSTLFYNCGIVFTSPNKKRFKNFAKESNCLKMYMKIPSYEEIRIMKKLLCTYQHIPENIVEERLEIYGPIPRLVLDFAKQGIKSPLNDALTAKGARALEVFNLSGSGGIMDGNDEDLSHTLVHLNTNDNYDYFYKPATRYITEEIFNSHREKLSNALVGYMKQPTALLNQAAGSLFDVIGMLTLLPNRNHSLIPIDSGSREYEKTTVTPVSGKSTVVISLGGSRKLPNSWFTTQKTFESDVLYFQPSTTLESIDGFSIIGEDLYLFQLTVSTVHPVSGSGIEVIIAKIKSFVDIMRVYLVFVTLAENTVQRIHTIQALKTKQGRNYGTLFSIPQEIRHIATEQYAIHIGDEHLLA